jgi:CpcD/allophycocyanin linker domain
MLDCMVKIDVTKMSSHSAIRSGSYSIKVPFSSLSRTMQFIHRSGGKVVEVTKLSATTALAELPPIPTPVYTSTSTSTSNPKPPSATAARPEQQSTEDRSKRGGKQNKR